jgi:hypothetical protein
MRLQSLGLRPITGIECQRAKCHGGPSGTNFLVKSEGWQSRATVVKNLAVQLHSLPEHPVEAHDDNRRQPNEAKIGLIRAMRVCLNGSLIAGVLKKTVSVWQRGGAFAQQLAQQFL